MRVPASHSLDRRLKPQKSALLNRSRDLGSNTRIHHALMNDDRTARLAHAVEHGLSVPGVYRAEVDELDGGARERLFGRGDGFGAEVERLAVRDERDVLAGLDHVGFSEGKRVGFGWDVLDGRAVQDLGFHEDDWVVALEDGGQEEAFCLGWRARDHDAEARDVCE